MVVETPGLPRSISGVAHWYYLIYIAIFFLAISLIGLVVYKTKGLFVIHPILYLITEIMGVGWLFTAIEIVYENKRLIDKNNTLKKFQSIRLKEFVANEFGVQNAILEELEFNKLNNNEFSISKNSLESDNPLEWTLY